MSPVQTPRQCGPLQLDYVASEMNVETARQLHGSCDVTVTLEEVVAQLSEASAK